MIFPVNQWSLTGSRRHLCPRVVIFILCSTAFGCSALLDIPRTDPISDGAMRSPAGGIAIALPETSMHLATRELTRQNRQMKNVAGGSPARMSSSLSPPRNMFGVATRKAVPKAIPIFSSGVVLSC